MEVHVWSGIFAALVALSEVVWLGAGLRSRFAGWSWWRPLAFLSGIAVAVGSVCRRSDGMGEKGSLTAHASSTCCSATSQRLFSCSVYRRGHDGPSVGRSSEQLSGTRLPREL